MSVIRMPVTNIMVVTPMGAPEVTEDHWLHRPRLEDRQGDIFCDKWATKLGDCRKNGIFLNGFMGNMAEMSKIL